MRYTTRAPQLLQKFMTIEAVVSCRTYHETRPLGRADGSLALLSIGAASVSQSPIAAIARRYDNGLVARPDLCKLA
jgi:hypothetical protein